MCTIQSVCICVCTVKGRHGRLSTSAVLIFTSTVNEINIMIDTFHRVCTRITGYGNDPHRRNQNAKKCVCSVESIINNHFVYWLVTKAELHRYYIYHFSIILLQRYIKYVPMSSCPAMATVTPYIRSERWALRMSDNSGETTIPTCFSSPVICQRENSNIIHCLTDLYRNDGVPKSFHSDIIARFKQL